MNQSLSFYQVFLSVAESGNISRSSKQLFISQPAVSKALMNLEKNLKCTLFIRSSRGVKLTEEGRLLYEYVKKGFDSISMGEERIKRISELGIGHLRIGVSITLCKYLLLPYLNHFVREYPHIKITIENQSSYHTLKQLEDKSLDIGLVAKPETDKVFSFYTLGEVEDIFVTTQAYLDNLLVREEDTDIFSYANIMLLNEENISRKFIEDYFRKYNIKPKHILEVSSMDLLIEFAKTGLGVACVIRGLVLEELKQGTLINIPLKNPVNKREVGFAINKDAYLSDSLRKFIDFIIN